MANNSIAVGMSGGVDSAVSALLLLEQGFDVQGIFMKNWEDEDESAYCSALEDFEDALQVADKLGIPLHAINFVKEYWDNVFEEFLKEYAAGRTPNPDVLCNRFIKFEVFQDYALSRGLEYVATGHYAKLQSESDRHRLFRATDLSKDQTYFLQAVPADRLGRCQFPLANLPKTEVRKIAQSHGFENFDKKDSTGICFIGERRFQDFLRNFLPTNPGLIINSHNQEVVGDHIGLAYYTLGQRQGLGIGGRKNASEAPWYVLDKRLESNELIVTQDETDLYADSLIADELNLINEDISLLSHCEAMVRYRTTPQACKVEVQDSQLLVCFQNEVRSITPGQYVAFYNGDECLGGAKIEQVGATLQ